MLVKARVPKARLVNSRTREKEKENRQGVSCCKKGTGRNKCGACVCLTRSPRDVIKDVKINSSGESVRIEDKINCETKSFVYVLQSEKDPRQYCGQSGVSVATRAKQHAYDIENNDRPVARHFEATGNKKHHLRMTPLMVIKSNNSWVRLPYERQFINHQNLIEEGIYTSL